MDSVNGFEYDGNEVFREFYYYYLNCEDIVKFLEENGLDYVLQKLDEYIDDCIYYDYRPFKSYEDAKFGIRLSVFSRIIEIDRQNGYKFLKNSKKMA